MWLLDATAQDQRKPIPDQPAANKPAVTTQQITGTDFRVKLIRQVLLGFDRGGSRSLSGDRNRYRWLDPYSL